MLIEFILGVITVLLLLAGSVKYEIVQFHIPPNSQIYYVLNYINEFNSDVSLDWFGSYLLLKSKKYRILIPFSRDWIGARVKLIRGKEVIDLELPSGCSFPYSANSLGVDSIEITKDSQIFSFKGDKIPYFEEVYEI